MKPKIQDTGIDIRVSVEDKSVIIPDDEAQFINIHSNQDEYQTVLMVKTIYQVTVDQAKSIVEYISTLGNSVKQIMNSSDESRDIPF